MPTALDGASDAGERVRAAFLEVQALTKQWMEKEREGISLLENFQTALLAMREALGQGSRDSARTDRAMTPFTASSDEAIAAMDPWLAEDLFAQIKELRIAFAELLERMYSISIDFIVDIDEGVMKNDLVLSCSDYTQFIASELAAIEAEYQHIETLLGMVSFDITTDQLRTLIISWSTSPFLDPERSREFRQRHDKSLKRSSWNKKTNESND